MSAVESGTPAERQLRQAKSNIAIFNQVLADAEKGNAVRFEEIEEQINGARAVLMELARGKVHVSSPAPTALQAAAVIHARAAGAQAVTEFQRNTAQHLLAELNLLDGALQRARRKITQRETRRFEFEQLLGATRNAGRDDVSALQHLDDERKSLNYARTRMRALISESNSVMKALQDQGGRLEGTGSKAADMLESLGVANSTILQIMRRNKADAWLVYGGMALTLILLYCIWWRGS